MEKENQIFGIRAIIEAVNAGKEIDKVFILCDELLNKYEKNKKINTKDKKIKIFSPAQSG
jgi:23S rRNA (guanosine2251-2'-O)-methyltransferase